MSAPDLRREVVFAPLCNDNRCHNGVIIALTATTTAAPNHPLATRSANGGGGRGDYYARKYRCAAGLGANAVTLEDCFSKFTKPERLDEDNLWCGGRHVTAVERSCNVPERLDEDNHWCGRRRAAAPRTARGPFWFSSLAHARGVWCLPPQ